MKVSAVLLLASTLAASTLAAPPVFEKSLYPRPPDEGPYVPLLPLPYLSCGKDDKSCRWKKTGAVLDIQSLDYKKSGIEAVPGGVKLTSAAANNRFYIVNEDGEGQEQFLIKNRAISIDVDVSHVGCGFNAAFYTIEMPRNLPIGQGYCDAQNTCNEMDFYEGNVAVSTTTPHACDPKVPGQCDHWGCTLSTKSDDAVRPGGLIDTTKPYTITTYMYTKDNTDRGLLSEIKQSYKQGKNVHWSNSTLTNDKCQAAMGSGPYWNTTGQFPALSDSLGRGHTIAFSLWGSGGEGMSWLDGGFANPRCKGAIGGDAAGVIPAANVTVTFKNLKISRI
ncbi:hypothetical protein HK098_000829 [Nowakowskiella sp. JEL0407]|nr:hypothetical protein HK098_000829 [Nowakowskiella sp. JEL0407]